jgi:glc operon protein GlcG
MELRAVIPAADNRHDPDKGAYMYLTTSEAQKMLQAAQAKAQQMGVKVSISVVDGRGDLLTMVRLDGVSWRTAGISKGKAYASANFGVPSADLTARAASPVMQAFMLSVPGECVPAQGAVPVLRDGRVLGAIGVSGAKAEEDEEIAKAGVAAIQ